MNDGLYDAMLIEYRKLSSELETERSLTTDSSRLTAVACVVACRAMQEPVFELLHGGDALSIASPCLRRSAERERL
jgi:hypothetical protein